MVKSDYRDLCGLPFSCDLLHQSPSIARNLADESENDMDHSDLRVTPDSGGDSSHGNGGNAIVDSGGSGSSSSSSSSASPDLELDHSRPHRVTEDSPTPNQVQRLLLVSPVRSPAVTEDDVLIMDGVLVNNVPRAPSSARRASISNLLLVSSGSQGSIVSGRGSMHSGFGVQFYLRRNREEPRRRQPQRNRYYEGSSNRWQAGPSNLQPQFPLPAHNIRLGQHRLSLPYGMQRQYPFHMNMTTPQPYLSPWLPGPRAAYTYAPTSATVQPAHYNYSQPSGSGGGPLPVDIRRPDGTPLTLTLPPPAQPPRSPVAPLVISAPPANGGRTAAPERPETQPPAPSARPFSWPPTVEEESAIWYALHGTSGTRRRARLPVFVGICSDGAEGQAPPPPSVN
ncbi:unnamed protein product [Urochloa decumbens]|uniref:Uncharacterized protein n=1 Tax=Urochloa decumbens TaxID=240449 RepID=A0ABC9H7Q7_9POAL